MFYRKFLSTPERDNKTGNLKKNWNKFQKNEWPPYK